MRPRGWAALVLGLALFADAGSAALAQGDAAVPHKAKRPAVATAQPPAAGPPPAIDPLATTPLPGAGLLHPAPTGPPPLRSAVRSRWSGSPTIRSSGEASCRARCAQTRLSCRVAPADDTPSSCDAAWTQCLSTCGGLTYGRAAPSAADDGR